MEPLLIIVLALILKIVSVQIEGKRRREAERERRRSEIEMETDRQEEAPVRSSKRKLPFEIPTMREADPNAETRLPQADRIFIRREKTAEPSEQPETQRRPRRAVKTAPEMKKAVEAAGEQMKSRVNPLYQARLAMAPTVHRETEVSPLAEEVPTKPTPRIPTDRERLIEGIILAEVLGKPKAYQKKPYLR